MAEHLASDTTPDNKTARFAAFYRGVLRAHDELQPVPTEPEAAFARRMTVLVEGVSAVVDAQLGTEELFPKACASIDRARARVQAAINQRSFHSPNGQENFIASVNARVDSEVIQMLRRIKP